MNEWQVERGSGIEGLARRPSAGRALAGDEVRLGIRAVSLNYRDLAIARGEMGPRDRAIVPASDAVAVVTGTGAGVRRFRPGDRVIPTFFPDWLDGAPTAANTSVGFGGGVDGFLAQDAIVPERALVHAPESLDDAAASTLTCAGVTAWHALFELGRAPRTVLLLGTGSVSLWALSLAVSAGMRVVITSSDDEKLARARALGADVTINYRTTDWATAARDLTSDTIDLTLDVGGRDTFANALAATRMGGTIAVIGGVAGGFGGTVDAGDLLSRAQRVAGVLVGSRDMTEALVKHVDRHRIEPVIDSTHGFDEVPAAYQRLGSGQAFGKIVVQVAGATSVSAPARRTSDRATVPA